MEIVEPVFKLYHIALENLLPILHKKHKKSYIGAAISLVFLQRVYSYFRAPKHLRHMPIIPYFSMVKSLLNHELAYSRFKRLILPAIGENNGIYVVCTDSNINNISNSYHVPFFRVKFHLIGLFILPIQ